MQITIRPTVKQDKAYEALWNPTIDTVFLGGGAGGGKSWFICESRLIHAYRYPGYKSYIGREELKRLMTSTYITWCKVCKYHHIPEEDWKLNGQYNYIEFRNGSRIDLLDLKYLPSDPLYERFGSLEYSDGAFEEAGEVHFLAYDVLKGRKNRHMNKELGIPAKDVITGNPKKNWMYQEFYKPWKEGTLSKSVAFIQSLYNDNPYTAEDYGKTLAQMKDKQNIERLMKGNWEYEDDPDTMMTYDTITDLFTNTIEDSEEKYLSVDAARFGGDKIVYTYWKGLMAYKIVWKEKQSTDTTEEHIKIAARDEQIPFSHIIVDEDGVGGGIVDHLKGIKGFVANSTPIEVKEEQLPTLDPTKVQPLRKAYENLKTQCAYLLADKVNDHQVAVRTEDLKIRGWLTEELEQLKRRDIDDEKKYRMVQKEDMKENLQGRSPDFADTFIMRMYFELVKQKNAPKRPFQRKQWQVYNERIGI